jgi:hypothetical protein
LNHPAYSRSKKAGPVFWVKSGPTADSTGYEDEGQFEGFVADLPVDADGLVLDYPGIFKRVRPD